MQSDENVHNVLVLLLASACLTLPLVFHKPMQVRIWEIPEGGLRRNMTEAVLELYGHSRRVGLIEWHPTSSGILFSAGYDYKVATSEPPERSGSGTIAVMMCVFISVVTYRSAAHTAKPNHRL